MDKKTPVKKSPVVHKPRKPRVAKEHAVKHAEPKAAAVAEEIIISKPAVSKVAHGKNYYAVGRRKTSVAQVLMTSGNGTITINRIPFEQYFGTVDLQQIVMQPLVAIGLDKTLNIKTKVHGGGIHSQAESVRHALSRAIISLNPEARRTLKKLGFLTRDPRVKERKKPGLKRARRAPQFSKR
jgi:small subunit ribosomal protein S9